MGVWLDPAYLKMCAQVVCVRAYVCVQIDRRRDGGVCRGASVYVDGKAGLLSFNIVLVGH